MDLVDYLRVLGRRWKLVVLATLLGLGAAAGFCATATPQYRADASLFVSMSDGANAAALMQGSVFTQQRVQSYTDVITSPTVLQPVIDELGLRTTPRELARRVQAQAPLGTVLLDVTVEDPSPEAAARTANAVATEFTEAIQELERPSPDQPSPVRASVIRPAVVLDDPVSPHVPRSLAVGLLLGLVAGSGLALLREALDTTITAAETLTELGAPALGTTLHNGPDRDRPQLITADARTPQSEALRQIRTSLQFADVDEPPRVVVLTSALPGEGKSTTAANLALTMAMSGLRTILVEADLRLPKAAEYLGVDRGAGLTTVLAGRADVDDLLQPYGDSGLSVLASGPIPVNPSALLGSRHMADLLVQLRERADLVIIDSPPLLPVTDAAVLARHADGVVLVVRHGRTTRDHLARALDRLRAVDARVLGGVLSMVPAHRSEYSGSYSYGYGYQPEVSTDPEPLLADR